MAYAEIRGGGCNALARITAFGLHPGYAESPRGEAQTASISLTAAIWSFDPSISITVISVCRPMRSNAE
jgi:hypothetical protein